MANQIIILHVWKDYNSALTTTEQNWKLGVTCTVLSTKKYYGYNVLHFEICLQWKSSFQNAYTLYILTMTCLKVKKRKYSYKLLIYNNQQTKRW